MKSPGTFILILVSRLPFGLLTSVAVLLLLWLTLSPQPLPDNDIPLFPGADKIAHLLMFGCVAWGVATDIAVHRQGTARATRIVRTVALAVIVLGGIIEILQEQMHMGRSGDVVDWIFDTMGAIVGGLVAKKMHR